MSDKKPETIYIYTLSDDTGVRYVGQTNNPKIRLGHHKCEGSSGRDRTPRGQWIKQLMDNGQLPVMVVIEECDRSISYEREAYWRTYYRIQDRDLLNCKAGSSKKRLGKMSQADIEATKRLMALVCPGD